MLKKIDMMHKMFGKSRTLLCKDCTHFTNINTGNSKKYKCKVYGITSSEASDWKITNVACKLAPNSGYLGKNIIELAKTQDDIKKSKLEQIDGQISMF